MMPPRQGTCRGCRHPVLIVQTDDEGLLMLERHESAGGAGRYAVWDDGSVHPVSSGAQVLAHQVHVCSTARRS